MLRHQRLLRLVASLNRRVQCSSVSYSSSAPSPQKKVVVTCKAFPETLSLLEAAQLEVVANGQEEPWNKSQLLSHCADADAMMCFMPDKVDADFLAHCPNLRIISCALKGFDNFDVKAATNQGVWVTYVPGLLTESTAELALGLILGANRNIRAGDERVRTGQFHGWRPIFYGRGLQNSTVGIWGFGAVGQAIAARLSGFGCSKVLVHDVVGRSIEAASLGCEEATLQDVFRSDVVVSAVPLTSSTYHGINNQTIAQCLSEQTLLVNISRGSVVEERAIANALQQGTLGGYAADVFEFEDWALPDRPREIHPELLDAPNTLFTPHLGSAVVDVRKDIERSAATAIIEWAKGIHPPSNALNSVA